MVLVSAAERGKVLRMSTEAEFTAVYRQRFTELYDYLNLKFPRLALADCEDLAQLVYAETLAKIRGLEGFQPNTDWWCWLCWLASKRALDYLRQHERVSWNTLAGLQSPALDASPSAVLAEAERRGRQGLTLSQVLTEFCRRCETRPEMLKQKEIYERSLRGQKPTEIAAALGMERGTVDVQLKRARDWILERVRQADVDRSVFLTFHRLYPEKKRQP